jgi:hypothetical protein
MARAHSLNFGDCAAQQGASMNKAALDASSQPLQSAHLLTNRVAAHINQ